MRADLDCAESACTFKVTWTGHRNATPLFSKAGWAFGWCPTCRLPATGRRGSRSDHDKARPTQRHKRVRCGLTGFVMVVDGKQHRCGNGLDRCHRSCWPVCKFRQFFQRLCGAIRKLREMIAAQSGDFWNAVAPRIGQCSSSPSGKTVSLPPFEPVPVKSVGWTGKGLRVDHGADYNPLVWAIQGDYSRLRKIFRSGCFLWIPLKGRLETYQDDWQERSGRQSRHWPARFQFALCNL